MHAAHHEFLDRAKGTLPETVRDSDLAVLNEGLAFLFLRLREARRLFDEEGDNGRSGSFTALGGLWMFLALFEKPLAEGLHVPILRLQDALAALDNNLVQSIVKPVARHGRAPSSHAHLALKGHVAATVDRLAKTGLKSKESYNLVARQLAMLGVKPERGSGPLTAHTVRNWCNEVRSDVGRRGTAAFVKDSVTEEQQRKFAELETNKARRFALDSLANWVRCLFPELKKAT